MPLQWTFDSRQRTADIAAEGEVSAIDAMALFDAIEGAEALSYNKLFDGTRGHSSMATSDVLAIAARIRAQHQLSVMGALAIVVTSEQAEQFARVLGAAAVADRPLKMFTDVRAARRWLDAQPSRQP